MKKVYLMIFILINFYSISQTDSMNIFNSDLNNKITRLLETPESARQYLTIRIFSNKLFDDSIKNNLIYQNDFDGLISVLTLNLDEAVRSINRMEIEHWHLNDDQLFEMAKEQTKKNVIGLSFESIEVDKSMTYYFAYDEQNYFINSLLYYPDLLTIYDKCKNGVIIGVPSRHVCTIMPLGAKESIYEELSAFYIFLNQIYLNESNPTTLNMFLFKNGMCYPISALYDDSNNFLRFLTPDVLLN
jgi:hypothetical protein